MTTKLVVDTSSIMYYFRYYYFDRDNGNIIYDKLNGFLFSKVKSKEIMIIDKVYDELDDPEFDKIRKKIKPFVKGSIHLFSNVQTLIKKYYIKSNERFFGNDHTLINQHIRKCEDRDADLYLIACCLDFISNGHDAILVTEENEKDSNYRKLIKKIPTICKHENIKCQTLPHTIFELYKNDLEFVLKIK